jgi:hypothetical protein
MLIVASRRAPQQTLRARYDPPALVLDLTSHGPEPWVRFSPFYPHGGIPVPFSPGVFSASVEGIWQGLKVFDQADVDPTKFAIATMRGIKRSARQFGRVLGHRAGVVGDRLLTYAEARHTIYLPTYRWVLDQRLQELVAELQRLARAHTVILLDFERNCDLDDLTHPLSHACLVRQYAEGTWPA